MTGRPATGSGPEVWKCKLSSILWALPPPKEIVLKTLIERSVVLGQAGDKPQSFRFRSARPFGSERKASMSQRSSNLLRDKLKPLGWGRGIQASLCALRPDSWMSQLQPDIPAQLGNHTPKWGGNLSCGASSKEEYMGVATIVFQG